MIDLAGKKCLISYSFLQLDKEALDVSISLICLERRRYIYVVSGIGPTLKDCFSGRLPGSLLVAAASDVPLVFSASALLTL